MSETRKVEPFNPAREFVQNPICPISGGGRRDPKDGPKRLCERLVRWAGKNGSTSLVGQPCGQAVRAHRREMVRVEHEQHARENGHRAAHPEMADEFRKFDDGTQTWWTEKPAQESWHQKGQCTTGESETVEYSKEF